MEKEIKERLQRLACALIDQEAAKVIVEPQVGSEGFWFGGAHKEYSQERSKALFRGPVKQLPREWRRKTGGRASRKIHE